MHVSIGVRVCIMHMGVFYVYIHECKCTYNNVHACIMYMCGMLHKVHVCVPVLCTCILYMCAVCMCVKHTCIYNYRHIYPAEIT